MPVKAVMAAKGGSPFTQAAVTFYFIPITKLEVSEISMFKMKCLSFF